MGYQGFPLSQLNQRIYGEQLVKLKNLLSFNDDMFLNDDLDFYWYWLWAGKRLSGLSGNPTAQKKSDNLYENTVTI